MAAGCAILGLVAIAAVLLGGCFAPPPDLSGPRGEDTARPVLADDTGDESAPESGVGGEESGGGTAAETAAGGGIPPGGLGEVYVPSDVGRIAVRLRVPEASRHETGAGVVVDVGEFLNVQGKVGFYEDMDAVPLGLVQLSYLWPGWADDCCASDGDFDYGGPTDLAALRDVIRFAAGELRTTDGRLIDEVVGLPLDRRDVGVWANSHPGMAAVRTLAGWPEDLRSVSWLVLRESPSVGALAALEIAHYDAAGDAVLNPAWRYPESYGPEALRVDYGVVRWDPGCCDDIGPEGRPRLDADEDGERDEGEYTLGELVPKVHERWAWSPELTRALEAGLGGRSWPPEVMTAAESEAFWAELDSPAWYPRLPEGLHVMLLFGVRDHVLPAADKPHVHQAWDGIHPGGRWVRLNPDESYLAWLGLDLEAAYHETPANEEVADWSGIDHVALPTRPGVAITTAPWVAIAELSDRAVAEDWRDDLDHVLTELPPPDAP